MTSRLPYFFRLLQGGPALPSRRRGGAGGPYFFGLSKERPRQSLAPPLRRPLNQGRGLKAEPMVHPYSSAGMIKTVFMDDTLIMTSVNPDRHYKFKGSFHGSPYTYV